MADKSKKKVFATIEEYRAYYQAGSQEKKAKGSKYYRLGTEIAKLASEKAMHDSSRQASTSQLTA